MTVDEHVYCRSISVLRRLHRYCTQKEDLWIVISFLWDLFRVIEASLVKHLNKRLKLLILAHLFIYGCFSFFIKCVSFLLLFLLDEVMELLEALLKWITLLRMALNSLIFKRKNVVLEALFALNDWISYELASGFYHLLEILTGDGRCFLHHFL